jgi:hypothetical protein
MPKAAISKYDPRLHPRSTAVHAKKPRQTRQELLSGSRHASAEEPADDRVMTCEEASEYLWEQYRLQRSPRRLGQLRAGPVGSGPEFHRVGNIPLYRQSKVNNWARAQLGESFTNTSDEQAFYAQRRQRILAGT